MSRAGEFARTAGGYAAGGYDNSGRYQERQARLSRGRRVGLGAGFANRAGRRQVNTMGRAPATIDAEWASENPEDAQAKLIDVQREDFNARYRPLEEAAIAEFMKSPERAAQRAGGIASSAFHGGTGSAERAMGRTGASMTAGQRRAASNTTGLAQARAVGTAENTTRRAIQDRNIEGIGTMVGIGKGIMGGTNRDMGAAAGMQNARNQAHAQAKDAHKQNMIGTGVAVAGLAVAF